MAELTRKDVENFFKAVDKAKPKKEDVERFKTLLLQQSDLWRLCGDLVGKTHHLLIDQMNGSRTFRLAIEQGYEQVKEGLGYTDASTLERLLIEQVALAWLRHSWIEYQYQWRHGESLTLTKAKYWEQKLSSSQHRLLRSIESLAKVRQLASRTPEILQVNIAKQQVNQAGALARS